MGALVVLTLYWIWQQPRRRRVPLSLVVVLVFAGLGFVLYRSPQFSRLTDLSNLFGGRAVADTGLVKRDALLKDAVSLWLQHPFTDWGSISSASFLDGILLPRQLRELLANGGIIGLLAYLMIYLSAFWSLVRSFLASRDKVFSADLFWSLTVLGVLIGWDFGAVSYYDRMTWILLAIVIGIGARARPGLDMAPGLVFQPDA